jgi:hypothetical protein
VELKICVYWQKKFISALFTDAEVAQYAGKCFHKIYILSSLFRSLFATHCVGYYALKLKISTYWQNKFISALFTGAKVAQYAGKHLHKYIVKRSEYKEGRIEDALRQVYYSNKIFEFML